jgi:hypothetical protein
MPVNHRTNGGSHSHTDRGLDSYPTPSGAVRALLKVETLPRKIWEPCAGHGAIATTLRDAGHVVIASDIADRGFSLHFTGSFLEQQKMPAGTEAIVTNFPFKWVTQFVEHALELSPLVIVLARLQFLASAERADILKRLVRFHVFENRLPMMHRESWKGNRNSSSTDFGWFILERNHRSAPWRGDRIAYEYLPGERKAIREANRVANQAAKLSGSRGRDHRVKKPAARS